MPVIIVNSSKEFKKVLKHADKALVKFEANWSMACKATVRSFEEVSKLFKDVKAISLDIDGEDVSSLLKKYDIRCVPSFLYFIKGKPVQRAVGLCTKQDLRNIFNKE